jgi:hypothetical protein
VTSGYVAEVNENPLESADVLVRGLVEAEQRPFETYHETYLDRDFAGVRFASHAVAGDVMSMVPP